MTIDLDQLTALVAAMTPGPWHLDAVDADICSASGAVIGYADDADAAGIVALVNHRDELLRLARLGLAYVALQVASNGPGTMEAVTVAEKAFAVALRAVLEGK